MRKFALLFCLLFVAGVAFAQQIGEKGAEKAAEKAAAIETGQKEAQEAPEKAAAMKTHDFKAEVVSADVEAKAITIKGETENKTLPVAEKALAGLKEIKGGEKVKLTCEDDEKGEHKHIVAIEMEKPEAPE